MRRLIAFLLIILSLGFIAAALIFGGAAATAQKAGLLCRECVGLG